MLCFENGDSEEREQSSDGFSLGREGEKMKRLGRKEVQARGSSSAGGRSGVKACGACELLLVQLLSLSPAVGLVPGAFSEQQPTAGFRETFVLLRFLYSSTFCSVQKDARKPARKEIRGRKLFRFGKKSKNSSSFPIK